MDFVAPDRFTIPGPATVLIGLARARLGRLLDTGAASTRARAGREKSPWTPPTKIAGFCRTGGRPATAPHRQASLLQVIVGGLAAAEPGGPFAPP